MPSPFCDSARDAASNPLALVAGRMTGAATTEPAYGQVTPDNIVQNAFTQALGGGGSGAGGLGSLLSTLGLGQPGPAAGGAPPSAPAAGGQPAAAGSPLPGQPGSSGPARWLTDLGSGGSGFPGSALTDTLTNLFR